MIRPDDYWVTDEQFQELQRRSLLEDRAQGIEQGVEGPPQSFAAPAGLNGPSQEFALPSGLSTPPQSFTRPQFDLEVGEAEPMAAPARARRRAPAPTPTQPGQQPGPAPAPAPADLAGIQRQLNAITPDFRQEQAPEPPQGEDEGWLSTILDSAAVMAPAVTSALAVGNIKGAGAAQVVDRQGQLQQQTIANQRAQKDARLARKDRLFREGKEDARLKSQDERQARLDSEDQLDRTRRRGREDQEQAISAEARDPASQKNQVFRQAVQKQAPEYWKSLTPEQQQKLTIADAAALAPGMEREQEDRQAQGRLKAQGQQQAFEMQKQRAGQDFEMRKLAAEAGYKQAQTNQARAGVSSEGVREALAKRYGGMDRIPGHVLAQVDLADQGDPAKRQEALASVLKGLGDMPGGDEKIEAGWRVIDPVAYAKVNNDVKGRNDLRKAMSGANQVDYALREMEKIRAEVGTETPWSANPERGRYEILHAQALNGIAQVVDSGVIQPSERATYEKSIPSLAPGISDPARLVGAGDPSLSQLGGARKGFEELFGTRLKTLGVARDAPAEEKPKDGASGRTNQRGIGKPAQTPAGRVRVRNKKTGVIGNIPSEQLQQALAGDFEQA